MVRWYMRYNNHELTIPTLWLGQMCVIGALDLIVVFLAGAALTGSHYRMDIISSVGHPRLNLVVPLVFCTVAYNIWDTDVEL